MKVSKAMWTGLCAAAEWHAESEKARPMVNELRRRLCRAPAINPVKVELTRHPNGHVSVWPTYMT